MEKLVSVPVVTYNAAEFVEETLESIFNQTHQNLQLIISDDCSKDNTVEIVQNWCNLPRVKERFADIKIITVPKNTGVSANCNRCIKASDAEWIKFIAGDDVLLPNCITDNLKFVAENQEARVVFSQVEVFKDNFEQNNFVKKLPKLYPDNLMHLSFTANDQFKILLKSDRISYTPSYFFNKKAIEEVNCYDETNTLVEDYPMWLKLTRAGTKLHYFHLSTVGYRIHSKATNNTGENLLFKPSVINSHMVRVKFVHPYLSKNKINQERWTYGVTKTFMKLGIVKKTNFNKNLYKFFTIYANPFFYFNYFSR